jgi:hypothetical protein
MNGNRLVSGPERVGAGQPDPAKSPCATETRFIPTSRASTSIGTIRPQVSLRRAYRVNRAGSCSLRQSLIGTRVNGRLAGFLRPAHKRRIAWVLEPLFQLRRRHAAHSRPPDPIREGGPDPDRRLPAMGRFFPVLWMQAFEGVLTEGHSGCIIPFRCAADINSSDLASSRTITCAVPGLHKDPRFSLVGRATSGRRALHPAG